MADPILDSFDAPAFSIDGETYVLRGTVDPSAGAGFAAPSSSLFLRKAPSGFGQVYLKTGALDTDWVDISSSAGGTVTSVGAIQPSEGLTISGGPITTTGSFTFALANDLAALEGFTGTGFAVRTNTDTWAQRQLVSSSSSIEITNPAGIAGNPSIDLPAVGTPIANALRRITTDAYGRVSASSTPVATDLNMATNRLLGRTTAGVGAVEEITVGTGLILTAGQLSALVGGAGQGSVLRSWVVSISAMSGTNNRIPFDNTTPLVTEGVQIATQTITPISASSKFIFLASFYVDCSGGNKQVAVTAFRGTTNIGVAANQINTSGKAQMLSIIFHDEPNTTSPTTYSFRIGTDVNTTWYLNQGSAPLFNGALANNSLMTLETS